jgi:radical SAM superfamily enzyme YgiQ (UPF0313 family)
MRVILTQLNPYPASLMNVNLAGGFLKAMAYKEGLLNGPASIEILDGGIHNPQTITRIEKKLTDRPPHLLGLSLYPWNLRASLLLARKIGKISPGTKIIAGGPEVTPDSPCRAYLRNIDILAYGEGEQTFTEILKHYLYGTPGLEEIKGIIYKTSTQIRINPPSAPLINLDDIPSPYSLGFLKPKNGHMWISAGRGCPRRCAFCSEWLYRNGKTSYVSNKKISEELLIAKKNKVRFIKLEMPAFNADFGKMKKLCAAIEKINRDHALSFTVELWGERIDGAAIKMLKRANIKQAEIGLETTDPAVLKNINRRLALDKLIRGVRLLNKAGIYCTLNLLFGLPGQTLQSFKSSLHFLLKNGLHLTGAINFNIVAVGPGTRLRKDAAQYGIQYHTYPPYTVIQTNCIRKSEIDAVSRLHSPQEILKL